MRSDQIRYTDQSYIPVAEEIMAAEDARGEIVFDATAAELRDLDRRTYAMFLKELGDCFGPEDKIPPRIWALMCSWLAYSLK
jgi:hypothetical protein